MREKDKVGMVGGEVVEIGIQANIAAIQKELLAWKKKSWNRIINNLDNNVG